MINGGLTDDLKDWISYTFGKQDDQWNFQCLYVQGRKVVESYDSLQAGKQ